MQYRISDTIEGPWRNLRRGVPHGGNGELFRRADGSWWFAGFYNCNDFATRCGDPSTMWWSDNDQPDPQWLMVDLGSERKVGGVTVAWWKAYAKAYTVQVSTDGQTWREVATAQGRNLWHGDADILRFEPVPARYVRLHCTQRAVTWQAYTVFELGVYEGIGRH